MKKTFLGALSLFALVVAGMSAPLVAADDYKLDPVHSSVTFKISHLGLSYVHGRFNKFEGDFSVDKDDPSKCSFALTINVDSIDTNNDGRDKHLKAGDFFDAKQFANITFKSTAVKAIKDGYEVTGDFSMHGVTKPITFNLIGGRTATPPGGGPKRTGYSTDLQLKRSDFGMTGFKEALGETVHASISFEGALKK